MVSKLQGSEASGNAPPVDPGILASDGHYQMPRMSDEFAPSPVTAVAYAIPAFVVLFLGLDWTVFVVCIGCELVFFFWSRVIEMWFMPGGVKALVATVFMVQPVFFVTVLLAGVIFWLVSGIPIEINGMPHTITVGTRVAALLSVVALGIDAIRRFRRVALPRVRFMQRVNARYMFEGEPDRQLFTGLNTIVENILLSFFGSMLVGLYVGLAALVMLLAAQVLQFFVAEDRAWATGAVLGFSVVRLAWETLRARVRQAGAQARTETAVLERLAAQYDRRIVLRAPRPG